MILGEDYLKHLRTKQSVIKTDYDLKIYNLDGKNKNQVLENKHKENLKRLENDLELNNLELDDKYAEN